MQDQSMNQYYGTTPNGNYSIRHSNPMSYTHPPNPAQYHSSPSHSHYSSQAHSYLPSTPLPLASHQPPAHELLSYLNQNPGVSSTSRPMPKDSQSILASLDQAIHSQEIQLAALKEQAQRSTFQWKQQLAMAHHHIPQYDAIGSVRHSSPAYHFSDGTLASPVSHLSPTPTLRESDVLGRHIQQSPTSAQSYYPNQLATAHQHAVPLHQHGSLMPVNPPSQSVAHTQTPTPSQLHPIPQTTDYVKIESQPMELVAPVPDATMRDTSKVVLLNDNPSVHSPPTLNRRLNMRRRSVCSAVKRQPSVSPTRHHQSDQDDNDHDDHDEDDEDEEDDCEVDANDRTCTLTKQADGRSRTKSASSTKAKRGQGVSCHSWSE